MEDDLLLVCSSLFPRLSGLFGEFPPEPPEPDDLSDELRLDDLLPGLPRLLLEERRQLPLPLLCRGVEEERAFIRATFSSNSCMRFRCLLPIGGELADLVIVPGDRSSPEAETLDSKDSSEEAEDLLVGAVESP